MSRLSQMSFAGEHTSIALLMLNSANVKPNLVHIECYSIMNGQDLK